MKVELSAPYAQSQNGGAERSGGVGSESRIKCLLAFGQRLIAPLFIFMIGLPPTPTVARRSRWLQRPWRNAIHHSDLIRKLGSSRTERPRWTPNKPKKITLKGTSKIKTWSEIYKFRDTYVRSFRAFIPIIAARFDLEPIKYDIVNAFLKTCLCHLVIEELVRSLNRIRPLAEYRVLRELGFQPISHEPCCSTRDGILVFFYVDDIDSPFDRIGKHWLEDWSNNQRGGNELQRGWRLRDNLLIEMTTLRGRNGRKAKIDFHFVSPVHEDTNTSQVILLEHCLNRPKRIIFKGINKWEPDLKLVG